MNARRRNSRRTGVALLALGTASSISAQQKVPAETPAIVSGASAAACVSDATRWFNQTFSASSDSVGKQLVKSIDFGAIRDVRLRLLRDCVLRLDAQKFNGAELLDLARTLAETREYSRALEASSRYLRTTSLSDSLRAAALLSMIAQFRGTDSVALHAAEVYSDQLDALPAAVNLQKIQAHEGLFRSFQFLENDLAVQRHTRAIIKYARGVKAHVKTKDAADIPAGQLDASMLLSVYMYAAIIEGNFGSELAGRALLQEGRRDHTEIESRYFDGMEAPIAARFALIGTPAQPIASERWFNTQNATQTLEFTGYVTVLGFTAHWCTPCHATYAPLQAMSDSGRARGLRMVFLTEFYGYVGAARKLTAQQEIDSTRAYYNARRITFPIAMLGTPINPDQPSASREMSAPFRFYGIQQIPQTVVVDRKGIIRRILVGWDPANRDRLPALIEHLLNEK